MHAMQTVVTDVHGVHLSVCLAVGSFSAAFAKSLLASCLVCGRHHFFLFSYDMNCMM